MLFLIGKTDNIMTNFTGNWNYSEEFDGGKDVGVLNLKHFDNKLEGELRYTEYPDGEEPFTVIQKVEGEVSDNKITLRGTEINAEDDVEYFADSFDGIYTAEGNIVGSTEDAAGVCGVFIFSPQ